MISGSADVDDKFVVHFDTFSSAVFLAGPYCSTCKGLSCSTCNTQNIYDPSASSTATSKTGNETYVVDFRGIAKVDAELVSDNFYVAGFKVSAYLLKEGTSTGS